MGDLFVILLNLKASYHVIHGLEFFSFTFSTGRQTPFDKGFICRKGLSVLEIDWYFVCRVHP